ncbi:hypothetical protein GLOIN_2v1572223 [Rhizophagus irregularis DAOM 181602=DAOM 197198]|nr:hypothetical protein GLOIN_2v1572223 [Rhizophagus irregularis DAOM 181602=DAOM 197198]
MFVTFIFTKFNSLSSSAQVVIYTENRIDVKPIEESMNFKISFMPRKAIGICNPKEYSKKSNLSSWRENLRKRLSLNVSILVSNVDVPFYPQGIQYVGQMGT